MKISCVISSCILLCIGVRAQQGNTTTLQADVCVYGATSAGIMAAYTAKKLKNTVVIIDPGKHIGGLTTGGLGFTDIGNKYAVTGLGLDFYRRIGKHYGKFESWIFEPHVASGVYRDYIRAAGLQVHQEHSLKKVVTENKLIRELEVEYTEKNGEKKIKKIRAKIFIDCSYEGDLMAMAGVSYTVGREANTLYGETYNGVQLRDKHQFPDGVDPYKIPGQPASGLLWGISSETLAAMGSGDKKVQAYNFRICLSDDPANQVPITRPSEYDAAKYELLLRVLDKKPATSLSAFLKIDRMPNHKTDINNNGAFSTDMIGMNYDYPESSYEKRVQIQKEHELYIKGLLYFIGHDARMPKHLRDEMLRWGYPKDEYKDNGNWSPQMYVREARRMIGAYVMSQANCEGREVVPDAVGMAAYTMDSHNCQRVVIEKDGMKMVKNEGDVQVGGFPPYPISFRSLLPRQEQCNNLLVPVCLSASHIAYGSIRMEPVFMVMGQSAAVAAVMALNKKTALHQVNIAELQKKLASDPLADGSQPEVMVDNDSRYVQVSGDWKIVKTGAYGPSMFTDDSKGAQAKSVRFLPALTTSGNYRIYMYFPKTQQASSTTAVSVFDGQKNRDTIIEGSKVKVEGQTSGEWVDLGAYSLQKDGKPYVEISNKKADGIVVADAVLFVPVKG